MPLFARLLLLLPLIVLTGCPTMTGPDDLTPSLIEGNASFAVPAFFEVNGSTQALNFVVTFPEEVNDGTVTVEGNVTHGMGPAVGVASYLGPLTVTLDGTTISIVGTLPTTNSVGTGPVAISGSGTIRSDGQRFTIGALTFNNQGNLQYIIQTAEFRPS